MTDAPIPFKRKAGKRKKQREKTGKGSKASENEYA
jgi:hypothetical protein